MEDTDKVLQFLEEFIKRNTNNKSKDQMIFKELNEFDKENINDVLKGLGIVYNDTF